MVVCALAGCSRNDIADTGDAEAAQEVRVILDYLPNPLHIGLFNAMDSGQFAHAGLAVSVDAPTSTTDTLRLMAAGRASVGLVPFLDFIKAREAGEPVVIIAAAVQRSLAAVHVLASGEVRRPLDLEGKLIGVSGVISDEVTVRSIVQADGGDPDAVRTINIGFNVVQNLIGGRVSGAVGFWNHEGVQLQEREPARIFKEDEWGIPPYPGIVYFAREQTLREQPEVIDAFLQALAAGYEQALAEPDGALALLARRIEGASAEDLGPYFAALEPVFLHPEHGFGYVSSGQVQAYLDWARSEDLVTIAEPQEQWVYRGKGRPSQ